MRIGLGCVNLGSATSSTSLREQIALVHQSIDGGITHFDTADAYASGVSEQVLGRALRTRRDHVTISTKGGYLFRERSLAEQRMRRLASRLLGMVPQRGGGASSAATAAPTPSAVPVGKGAYSAQDFTARHLRGAVEASLRRLGTEHIDVFLLHGPPEVDDQLFASIDDLRSSGKVGRFGVGAESITSAGAWSHVSHTDVVQLPFGVLDVDARIEVFGTARSNDVEVWARGILGGGLLSAADRDIGSVAAHPKRSRIETLVQIADGAGMKVDELAIRWVRTCSDIDLMLLGMSSATHLERNLELAAKPPLAAELADLVEATFAASGTRSDGESGAGA